MTKPEAGAFLWIGEHTRLACWSSCLATTYLPEFVPFEKSSRSRDTFTNTRRLREGYGEPRRRDQNSDFLALQLICDRRKNRREIEPKMCVNSTADSQTQPRC
jgi:hypothetical protein